MNRITIIHRTAWVQKNRGHATQVEEYETLRNLTDKKLEATLAEMNMPYRKNFWTVVKDFHMDKQADARAYCVYCIGRYYDRYNSDEVSAEVGSKMASAMWEEVQNAEDKLLQKG